MRIEKLEPRVVFDQALGAVVEFNVDTGSDQNVEAPELPTDIEFRDDAEDFNYASDSVDPDTLDDLVAATAEWAEAPRPIYTFDLDDNEAWRKLLNHNPVSVHPDGYIIAERVESQADRHTLLVVQRQNNACHMLSGTYTRPDHHYRFSFDIKHPETELSWLTQSENHWTVVTEFWGPGSAGVGLNPPFAIYTQVKNGVPYWSIASRGDSREDTVRPYEEERTQFIPMENVGDWHSWDIEYVPSHEGQGMARAWLNGELVVDWVDVKSSYLGYIYGEETGPLNPAIGLYSYDSADGQEAYFDNISMQCDGLYESSISGRITGTETLDGNVVFATNQQTGERHGVETNSRGLYTLAMPRGEYTITAVNKLTGDQMHVEEISTLSTSSQVVDIDVTPPIAPPPAEVFTMTGDVTGNGVADIITRTDDGTWQVTTVDAAGNTATSAWTNWSTDMQWEDIMLADVDGDDRQDILARAENGSWWVARSTGDEFVNENWGKWTPTVDWLHVSTGDFNGDGRDDIVGRAATNGSWWIAESTGEGFRNASWGRWTTNVNWEVLVGDFNGDGLSDIAGRADTDGTWWIGASNGTRFQNSYWGKFTNNVAWSEFQIGDFNADGKTDLVARATSDGTWWVAESTGTEFQNRYFGSWMKTIDWGDVQIADVDGDGRSDVVGRALSDNSWWIGASNGDAFQNQYWGATWEQGVDWYVAVADDFDGDGTADLLGANVDHFWLSR